MWIDHWCGGGRSDELDVHDSSKVKNTKRMAGCSHGIFTTCGRRGGSVGRITELVRHDGSRSDVEEGEKWVAGCGFEGSLLFQR